MPGLIVKLVPNSGKLEARLKGPNITPGYWKNPEQTKAAFDEEGFYKIGDALKFADETDPRKGFVFDGRVAEDFKLVTGTWVSVGSIRAAVIEAFQPLVRDAVIAGHDKGEITALLVPDPELCRLASGLAASATPAEVYASPVLLAEIRRRLQALAKSNGSSSTRVERVMLLAETLSLDRGEVTDKGSINQRAVLAHRAGLVTALYAGGEDARVIHAAPARETQGTLHVY